jgi:hypothetical protein
MDLYRELADSIIREQQHIIGPVALTQAKKVAGISIENTGTVEIQGSGKDIVQALVEQYAKLFGKASIQVCKEAVESLLNKMPASDIPDILKT